MPEIAPIDNLWDFLLLNFSAIGPTLHLIVWGMVILCIEFLLPKEKKGQAALYAMVGILSASVHMYWISDTSPRTAFYDMIALDSFAIFFGALFLFTAFIAVMISYRYLDVEEEQHAEYYVLILFATAGMIFMAGAIDLVSLFVGLELTSISIYVLVGFLRGQRRSNEASMKYFLLGAFSTGIILYGMSILYGLSGSTNLYKIGQQLGRLDDNFLLVLALFMMMAGLCFKVAAVPFHMWAPDAYEGAPTSITAFMSVAVKIAGFAIFFRIFYVAFGDLRDTYLFALAVITMLTMTWGNIAALTQQNVKRLLAYSSISHAGFVLMGLVAGTDFGVTASAVYLLAYTFMNLGVWSVVILLRRKDISGENIEDFNGLFFKHPVVAIMMLIFFLSLAGIPPLGGFIAKYFVFAAVIDVALDPVQPYSTLLVWVAVVGALNAVVSLYYYFRIVVSMFFRQEHSPTPLSYSVGVVVALVITGILTILVGVYPQPFIELARSVSLPLT